MRSCITLAAAADECEVRTIEGYGNDPLMVVIRQCFAEFHAVQCGFCTPGMLATAYDVLKRLPNADRTRIRLELSGNLCRCTGYLGIITAAAVFRFKNWMICELPSEPSKEDLIALIAALRAENAALKARLA